MLIQPALVGFPVTLKLGAILAVVSRDGVLHPLHVVSLEVKVAQLVLVSGASEWRLFPGVKELLHGDFLVGEVAVAQRVVECNTALALLEDDDPAVVAIVVVPVVVVDAIVGRLQAADVAYGGHLLLEVGVNLGVPKLDLSKDGTVSQG